MEISIPAEKIFEFNGWPITNTLTASVLTVFIWLVLILFLERKGFKKYPRGLQNLVELAVEKLYGLFTSVIPSKKISRLAFPLVAAFFIFIMTANWLGILPGFGSIGIWASHNGEKLFVPLFRTANSDLNLTLALAMSSVLATQIFGILALGLKNYSHKFFNFKGPIEFFVGILELVSEAAKVISFSFRLFGNIFAGEVLLIIVAFLAPLIAPLPFYFLELFVGFIQALVFTMLTIVFIRMATAHH